MASGEKTEKATQKKRDDERKKGNIFQSRDVTSSLGLLAIVFILKLIVSPILLFTQSIIVNSINSISTTTEFTDNSAMLILAEIILRALLIILPVGLATGFIGFILSGVQTRFLVTKSRLKPDFSKLNPLMGIKRIFSRRALIEFLKSVIKVIIIASVLYTQINSKIPELILLPEMSLEQSLSWLGNAIYDIVILLAVYMTLFAAADYLYQWGEYTREIRMTKQEVKDEYKQTEGDPQLKSRIKDVQRKMAQMRMIKKVPQADVVIRNPTHYAVALKYNPPKDKAPVLIAKGQDYLALKIIETAEQNGIYITENKPLARGLYEAVELNRAIPPEFYRPVADILAFIYKLKKTKKGEKR